MVKRNTILIVVAIGSVGGLFGFGFILAGNQNLVQGNVSQLALTQNFRDFNCDAWNELAVTRNGVVSVVGSGRTGFNPSFDSSLLAVTDGTTEVSAMHFRLLIQCDGNFIDASSPELGGSTSVSGSFNIQICANPRTGTTVCLVGNDRTFARLEGSVQAIQTFSNVPLTTQPLQEDVRKIIWEGDLSASEIERLFTAEAGTIHFQSTMFPILTFNFVCTHTKCPVQGTFTASYSAITANQPIIAQYGALRVADVDTDGDGIFDLSDGCINQPETFNMFQDADGCPDTLPILDTDGDGILDTVDSCVADPETFNMFQDEDGCPDTVPDPDVVIVPPIDTDGDTVPDEFDMCITEFGTLANAGCPEPVIAEIPTVEGSPLADDDGDGVLNAVDECPNDFGTLLNSGCPESQRLPVVIPPPLVPEPQVVPIPQPIPQPVEEGLEITPSDIIILMGIFGGIIIIIIIILSRTGKIKIG